MAVRSRSESPWMGEARDVDFARPDAYPLCSVTSARKRVEQDHILLANRIRLLRAEEEKTRKRIRETEKKTGEILDLRRQTEQRRLAKEAEDARREAEERELRSLQQKERDEQRRKLKEGHQSILGQKVAMSAAARHQREVDMQAIEEQRLMEAADAMARAERVRLGSMAASRSRARSEGVRQEQARLVVQERLAREEDARRSKALEIERMEREEAQLISRLQQSQERHRSAYLRLEDALQHQQHGGHVLRSGCSTPMLSLEPPSGTSSSSSRAPAAAASAGSGRGAARPPRPVGPPTSAHGAAAASAAAAGAGASSRLGTSRPGSSKSSPAVQPRSGRGSPCEGRPPLLQQPPPQQLPPMHKHGQHPSARALSSCSTASGGELGDAGGGGKSGQSTPVPSTPHQITYTTVDGKEIDLSVEDDLDLATLLNT